jgi:hypothetical protein
VVQDFGESALSKPGILKPNLFIFDSTCHLSLHVKAQGKHGWDSIGLPVDIFHFKSKHKETDQHCQEHCNPTMFEDLLVVNEKTGREEWYLNTSISEQNNVWLGGFHTMCIEMRAVFYDFFLDEMIRLQNEVTLVRLHLQGAEPHYW